MTTNRTTQTTEQDINLNIFHYQLDPDEQNELEDYVYTIANAELCEIKNRTQSKLPTFNNIRAPSGTHITTYTLEQLAIRDKRQVQNLLAKL